MTRKKLPSSADDALIAISKEMRTQDNRCGQYPFFVVIEEVKNYCGHDCEYDGRERAVDTEPGFLCGKCSEIEAKGDNLPEDCEDCDSRAFDPFKTELRPNLNPGVFLTAKACEEHIAVNDYHYRKPKCYGFGCWRNPEMPRVMQAILTLTGNDIPSHYR